MKLDRRLFSIGLIAAIACGPTIAAAETALERISTSKTIRIAIPADFPPYGFVGSDMLPRGLDIDMASLIADKLGAKAELVPVTTANRVPYLQTNKVDLVISTLGKNPEREAVIDFASAYSPFFIAVFGPKDANIPDPKALSGKTIGVTRGSVDDAELTKVAPADATIMRFEDNNGTISAFVSGQTQLVAAGASVAAAMMEQNPSLEAEYKFLLKESPNYVGVAKGQAELKSKVNEIIASAKADGTLEALAQKWLKRSAGNLPE
ncbi:transporter substrate-binding domain-containing protein [Ensifer adhaerens]|jgi:polar amino acid transport system substrate-binding protein|uniref:transporter substrate-binding domain-containing protein n=1 Tax=Ensifer adhaerens TaxID=106592 RepID=UPI00202E9F55|nr:transporter substrate-binding domain-containing protein [Ensifer adhaerens]